MKFVINNKCLLCILTILNIEVNAQTKQLVGDFHESTSMWDQEQNYLSFYANQTFTYYKWSDFGDFYGAGRYTITKDSISFEFCSTDFAQNKFEILEGEVDSAAASNGLSLFRALHAVNPNIAMMLSYQLFRNDPLISQGGESAFGVLKLALKEGDSLNLTATDWGQTWLSYPMKISNSTPKSYVLIIPIRAVVLEPNMNETFRYRLNRTGDKLILIRNGEPNFFHPDTSKRIEYLKVE